jgi:hypothetical protein
MDIKYKQEYKEQEQQDNNKLNTLCKTLKNKFGSLAKNLYIYIQ